MDGAEEESAEMMQQIPVEIAEGAARKVSPSGRVPEGKRQRTVGGQPVSLAPLNICVIDQGGHSGLPVAEQDLSNVRGALSGKPLPAHEVE